MLLIHLFRTLPLHPNVVDSAAEEMMGWDGIGWAGEYRSKPEDKSSTYAKEEQCD